MNKDKSRGRKKQKRRVRLKKKVKRLFDDVVKSSGTGEVELTEFFDFITANSLRTLNEINKVPAEDKIVFFNKTVKELIKEAIKNDNG